MSALFLRHRHVLRALFLLVVGATVLTLGVGGCETRTFVLGDLGVEETGQGGDPSANCSADGAECVFDAECCGNLCLEGVCTVRSPACRASGGSCSNGFDCCSRACVEGTCAEACVDDAAECTSDEECCSGTCASGRCTPLSNTCSTSGNGCSGDNDCCSGLCWQERCDADGSFCMQERDACRTATDCCSGTCAIEGGAALGTCAPAPTGPSFCSDGIAGTLCETCNDCCSRLCVPYGTRGIFVCAMAEGCRQTGEICVSDAECCGGDAESGLPGAGNSGCQKDEGEVYGICRNAMSCSPQGNVCHIQDYACGVSAAANRCCGPGGSDGECVLDSQGIPRCDGLGGVCLDDGASCAFDGDCCSGTCSASPSGALLCGTSAACLPLGDSCSASSECCPGTSCERDTGEPFGSCAESESSVSCSLVGQLCGGAFPACCAHSTCGASGRCEVPVEESAAP